MIFVEIAVFLFILELSGSSLAKRDVECSEEQLQCPYDGKCLDVKDICTASTVCDKWDNFQFHKCITNEGFTQLYTDNIRVYHNTMYLLMCRFYPYS